MRGWIVSSNNPRAKRNYENILFYLELISNRKSHHNSIDASCQKLVDEFWVKNLEIIKNKNDELEQRIKELEMLKI